MAMTIPTMQSLDTYFVHCGNYRHFEVQAKSEQDARDRFKRASEHSYFTTMGFTEKDITKIEKKRY